ncbi:MAG: 1,6-anhydro-N-acetylmuramyl-L-alanine amidase AmpD [Proteobacteria bacterium]|nr:1,6-anhydro-N-acetylmuramyl-L-alanine amidase AmpD [Pseudomonadota bacterium]
MNISPHGWLDEAHPCPSPNCDVRPEATAPDLVVIHGISLPPGEFGGPHIEALFTNTLDPDAHPYFRTIHEDEVSAHILIRRDGSLTQFVPFGLRAWHAGASSFQGRTRCNDFSIGIELEGSDDTAYEDAQYISLAHVIRALMRRYPGITPERIVGHSDIAPERKTDPGPGFDWARLHTLLAS